jgi:hypothetical protein
MVPALWIGAVVVLVGAAAAFLIQRRGKAVEPVAEVPVEAEPLLEAA